MLVEFDKTNTKMAPCTVFMCQSQVTGYRILIVHVIIHLDLMARTAMSNTLYAARKVKHSLNSSQADEPGVLGDSSPW